MKVASVAAISFYYRPRSWHESIQEYEFYPSKVIGVWNLLNSERIDHPLEELFVLNLYRNW